MAEVYHEDVLELLAAEQRKGNDAINAVHDLVNSGSKYTAAAKTQAVAAIKLQAGSDADEYVGNPRPV